LSSILLKLGVFTVILLLTVFASIYVERLASALNSPATPATMTDRSEHDAATDDSVWRR